MEKMTSGKYQTELTPITTKTGKRFSSREATVMPRGSSARYGPKTGDMDFSIERDGLKFHVKATLEFTGYKDAPEIGFEITERIEALIGELTDAINEARSDARYKHLFNRPEGQQRPFCKASAP